MKVKTESFNAMKTNLYFDIESGFIKTPKKNRDNSEEYKKDNKKKSKRDYSKQRERKRETLE